MTDAPKTATGYTEAEGYAATLRQQAKWIREALDPETPEHQRVGLEDIDSDELECAALFIERLAQCGVQTASEAMDRLRETNAAEYLRVVARETKHGFDKYELPRIAALIEAALALSSAAPACTCGGDMAHDYHQDWCPAVSSTNHPGADAATVVTSQEPR